ncbi:MAG TPA: histidine--tRNA ligase, partial [Desulfurella acetivorans]|nr:histidine--tRNA ligase [Desulfurella acetivorans]
VYCEYDSKSLKSMLKKANKLNATVSIIVGEEEFKNNTCIIRNMKQSSQEIIKLNQMESTLKGVLYAT